MSTVVSPPAAPPTGRTCAALPAGADAGIAQLALSLQAAVLSFGRSDAAATAFVTEIALAYGCARVTLGFVNDGHARVVAVSHGTPGRPRGDDLEEVAAAMDEAIDQGISLVWPPQPGSGAPGVRLAHQRLQQRQGGSVASVPLLHLGSGVGALCCEWPGAAAEPPRRLDELEDLVSLVGPVLHLMRETEAGAGKQLMRAARRTWARLRSRERRGLRVACAAAALALAALLLVPLPQRVGGSAHIEALQQRALVAPLAGLIQRSEVRPGDRVRAGQVLVEMADEDLQMQRRKWQGELAQHENTYATALARADRTGMMIGHARAEEARAQLGLIDAELARARLVAPFDGIVLSGDLSQSLGAPVERGQPLLLLAPGEQYRVKVRIDERDIGAVQPGQPGTLALSALPWRTLPIRVERVTPIAATHDGQNVFEVEAAFDDMPPDVRPGLQGSARITVGEAPPGLTYGTRLAGWLRLQLFALWP